jgi:hypothetical protein
LFGTHNWLLSIGSVAFPLAYLEIIAINTKTVEVDRKNAGGLKRWFNMQVSGI